MAPLPQRAPQTHHRPSTCDEIAPRPQDHAYPPAPRRRRPKIHSSFPLPKGARLTTFASFRAAGYPQLASSVPKYGPVPAYSPKDVPKDWRGGGYEPEFKPGAAWGPPGSAIA
eukprot:1019250-Prymnesium_polylepis.1